MKRIFTLLLTLAMTFSLAMPAQAANNTKASTMRLMETEGTATVENAIGKKLTIQDKMRLYSGYEVSTEKASYAYISLDNSKAVKLDASSAVQVNQSGKKLELNVTAGELLFNVPVALKSDESLNIRTSTMVTGIRGTAGWVNALDRYTTRVGVLEGSVTIQSFDPFTGAERSVTIVGGQIATIIRHERANAIQQQLIDDGVIIEENIVAELTKPGQIVEEIQEADIPGFVAEEVSSNSDLQDRIREESPLNVDEIIEDADQRLDEEEKAAEKQDALIQKELKELAASNPGLPFATPEVIVQTNTITNTITNTEYKPTILFNATNDDIDATLEDLDTVVVATISAFDLCELNPPAGKTVYLLDGSYYLDNSDEWKISNGTVICTGNVHIENHGTITTSSTGSLKLDGGTDLINYGNLSIENGTSGSEGLILNGVIENYSYIDIGCVGEQQNAGQMRIDPNGKLYNYSVGGNEARSSSYSGEIRIWGEYLPVPVMLTAEETGNNTQTANSVLTNNGAIYNYAVFANAGILKIGPNGTFCNGLEYDEMYGFIFLPPAAEDNINYFEGYVYNLGEIINSGSLKNYCEFENFGQISNGNRLQNYHIFYNRDGGIITATGSANYAFENHSSDYRYGQLYMTGGSITASGNCCALYFTNGNLNVTAGKIAYSEINNGAGCALLLDSADSAWSLEGSTGCLYADNTEHLIDVKTSGDLGNTCYYDPEYTGHYNIVSVDNFCFPYTGNAEDGYCIDLSEMVTHGEA